MCELFNCINQVHAHPPDRAVGQETAEGGAGGGDDSGAEVRLRDCSDNDHIDDDRDTNTDGDMV